jgi:hypothetical protein
MQLKFPDPPLAAGGIVLRRLDGDDTGWITRACADPGLSRYIPDMPHPYSVADALAFAEHAARSWADRPGSSGRTCWLGLPACGDVSTQYGPTGC